jgi:hypothetical protein
LNLKPFIYQVSGEKAENQIIKKCGMGKGKKKPLASGFF